MGRKVFVSVLGMGFYNACKYVKGDFVSSNTRFIQCATLELIKAKEWGKEDAIVILLTDGAKKVNWNENLSVRRNGKTQKEEPYEGLQKLIKGMDLPCVLNALAIPDGKNEEEMWQIFETLYNELHDKDELYFDLTHSFRYLPMLVLVLGNYAKFVKNVSVESITYGNYEMRSADMNEAPIIDLLPLSQLQDWTSAAANYLQNGDVSFLDKLCKKSLKTILSDIDNRKKNPSANILRDYVQALHSVTEEMKWCRGIDIISGKQIEKAKHLSKKLSQIIISPMQPIVKKMRDSFDRFTPSEDILNGYRAANWCYEHQMYQQSLTILHENIVSHVCNVKGWDYKDKEQRELVNKAFSIKYKSTSEEEWNVDSEERKSLIKELLDMDLIRDLEHVFLATTTLRNDYNHAGMRDNPVKIPKIAHGLKNCIETVYRIFSLDDVASD